MAQIGRQYNLTVDGQVYHLDQKDITGAGIKQLVGAGPNFGLFMEGKGHAADQAIADDAVIDLSLPGHAQFYTAPPATFGT